MSEACDFNAGLLRLADGYRRGQNYCSNETGSSGRKSSDDLRENESRQFFIKCNGESLASAHALSGVHIDTAYDIRIRMISMGLTSLAQ